VVKITYSDSEESYTLDYSSVYGGSDKYLSIKETDDIYTDRNQTESIKIYWKIELKDDGYTIRNEAFGYLSLTGGTGEQPVKATPYPEEAAVFQIISITEISDYLGLHHPINATCLIGDPNFSYKHLSSPWTVVTASLPWSGYKPNLSGGGEDADKHINHNAECYKCIFDIYQNLVGIPNGVYKLQAQAALTDYTGEYDGRDYPVVYANDSTSIFQNMEGSDRGSNMPTMSVSFTAGKYFVDPIEVTVENEELKIGVRGTRTDTWACWDNFTLTYLGPVPIPDQTVSIGPSGYATFYSSVSAFTIQNTSDTEVYYVKSTSGEGAVMSMNLEYFHNNLVPKGKGVIIKGVPNTEYTLTAEDIPASSLGSVLEGCDGDTDQNGEYDYFTLDVKDGTLLFGKYDSSKTLKANKAYYRLSKTE